MKSNIEQRYVDFPYMGFWVLYIRGHHYWLGWGHLLGWRPSLLRSTDHFPFSHQCTSPLIDRRLAYQEELPAATALPWGLAEHVLFVSTTDHPIVFPGSKIIGNWPTDQHGFSWFVDIWELTGVTIKCHPPINLWMFLVHRTLGINWWELQFVTHRSTLNPNFEQKLPPICPVHFTDRIHPPLLYLMPCKPSKIWGPGSGPSYI